jgi:hypothetical protein
MNSEWRAYSGTLRYFETAVLVKTPGVLPEKATLLSDSAAALHGTYRSAAPPQADWLGFLVFVKQHITDSGNSSYHVEVSGEVH